jgi:SET domain-containing protein
MDTTSQPPIHHSRNQDRLRVDESPMHGRGVFAREAIPAGEPVILCGGVLKGPEDITPTTRALQIAPDKYLVEDPDNPGMDDYINHSCTPNLGYADGSLVLFALRDIAPGEELTWDYSTAINEAGWEVECGCGSSGCRGKIQSYCDLPEDERRRLSGLVLAYLR